MGVSKCINPKCPLHKISLDDTNTVDFHTGGASPRLLAQTYALGSATALGRTLWCSGKMGKLEAHWRHYRLRHPLIANPKIQTPQLSVY
jgi:hypothetical protein